MKLQHLLLSFLLHSFFSLTFAQQQSLTPEPLPQWAQWMYAGEDIGKVKTAYEAYYQTHSFEKNTHTQYYKRWLRTLSRDRFHPTLSDPAVQRQVDAAYLRRAKQAHSSRGANSPWQPLGPYDFDIDAAGRSYAPGAAHVYTVEQAVSNTNILYAGTATAGVWKSTDKGMNWSLLTHDMMVNSVRALEINHLNPQTVYFGGNGNVYKSTDGGQNWALTGDAAFQSISISANDIVMHPTDSQEVYLASDQGFYRTTDGGQTWNLRLGGEAQEIEIHPTQPQTVYCVRQIGDHTEFFKSINGGLTFEAKANGWPGISGATSSTFNSLELAGGNVGFGQAPALGTVTYPDFTIEMRVRTTSWTGDPAIISNKNWSNGYNRGFVIAAKTNGDWKFNMGDGTSRIDLDGDAIDDGAWHHLAVTYDANGTKAVYQDGTLINSTTTNLSNNVANAALRLFMGQDGTGTYAYNFPGDIAEVRIWTTALTAADLAALQCASVTSSHPQYANLLHHWKADEGTGIAVNDSKGTNHGSLNGSTNWLTNSQLHCVTTTITAPDEQKRTEISVTPDAPNRIYALTTGVANGGSGLYGLYISDNAGDTWTFQCCGTGPAGVPSAANPNIMDWSTDGSVSGGQYYYDMALAASHVDSSNVLAGGINIWRSSDHGLTLTNNAHWTIGSAGVKYVHADVHDIRFYGNDLWVAGDGGIFYSNDNGSTFNKRMFGIQGTDFWGFGAGFQDGQVMLGGTYHNATLLKDNNVYLTGWMATQGGDNYRGFVNFGDPRVVYHDGGRRRLSGDRTVALTSLPFDKNTNASYIIGESSDIAFDPRCYNILYTATDAKLWRSENGGVAYDLIKDFGAGKLGAIEVAWSDPDVLYVVQYPGWWDRKMVWRSRDGGQNWTEITPSLALLGNNDWVPYDVTVSSYDEDVLWLARTSQYGGYPGINGNQIFKSTDGGTTWVSISTPTLDGLSFTNIVHQRGSLGGVYLGTREAVYYRNDTLSDWQLFNNNLPLSTFSTKLIPYYKEGKIRNGTNRSVYEAEFYEQAAPSAQIAADRLESFCTRDTVQFVDHSALHQSSATWAWQFPGGMPATSSDQHPKVVYTTPGTYDVTLTVTDAFGTNSQTISGFMTITAECEPDTVPALALDLQQSGDYAIAPALDLGPTNELTISAWVKPNGIQPDYTGIVIGSDGSNTAGFNVRPNNELGYHWPGGAWWWSSGLYLPTGEWSHVALVVTPTAISVYLNGEGRTHTTSAQQVDLDLLQFYLGSYIGWASRNFTGQIDEVCIWDRPLTQAEIREQQHLTKKPINDASLVAYYQFNRLQGDVADKVGIRHAAMVGGAGRTTSTAPVGGGVSSRMTVASRGTTTFGQTGLSLDFPTGGTYPDGEVVVTRINLSPDQAPTPDSISRSYWVINNHGANATFTQLSGITFDQVGSVASWEAGDPSGLKLYKRGTNDDGATWGSSIDDGDAATAGSDGSVTFSNGNGITSFSQFVISHQGTPPLAIDGMTFRADVIHDQTVALRWVTTGEKGNAHFVVERSADGALFTPIFQQPSQGDSETSQYYEQPDLQPLGGVSFYRLRAVDVDGNSTFSEIRRVVIHALPAAVLVYPNPVGSSQQLTFQSQLPGPWEFVLYDATGREVAQGSFEGMYTLEAEKLSEGVYFYQVLNEGKMVRGRVVILNDE